jgi:hypothetical protein
MNKKELLDKWMITYKEVLQPTLETGKFRFADEKNFTHFRNIQLAENTYWGGEPAGDILTNYLRPGKLTIYTTETRNNLIKNYRLIPEPKGDITVYRKFWKDAFNYQPNLVPILLVYTDLMNTGNSRCHETARMIWDKHLANEF